LGIGRVLNKANANEHFLRHGDGVLVLDALAKLS